MEINKIPFSLKIGIDFICNVVYNLYVNKIFQHKFLGGLQ